MHWLVQLGARFLLACSMPAGAALGAQQRDIDVVPTRPAAADDGSVRQAVDGATIDFGRYHALLIGVERYAPEHPDLATPRTDVEALRDVLVRDFQFAAHDVRVLLDVLAARLGSGDNLLVFYAGHGTAKWRDRDWAEGFWVPYGATARFSTWLSATELRAAIRRIEARHVLVISDSCYSGAIKATRSAQMSADAVPLHVQRAAVDPSYQLLASGKWEVVADHGRDGHSVFAWHLLRALRRSGQVTTARELAGGIIGEFLAMFDAGETTQEPEWVPELVPLRGSTGQFVFCRPPVDAMRAADATADVAQQPAGVPPGWRLPAGVRALAPPVGDRDVAGARAVQATTFWFDEAGLAVELVLVPGGTFEWDGAQIEVRPFLIDRDEVSNARYEHFKNTARPSDAPRRPNARAELFEADRPVSYVALRDARNFARATAPGRRLPTEHEWLWAAGGILDGAGPTRLRTFAWGDDLERETTRSIPANLPARIGEHAFDESGFGLRGTSTGVQEFCELVPHRADRGVLCGGRDLIDVFEDLAGAPRALRTRREVGVAETSLGKAGFRCLWPLVPLR